MIFVLDGYSSYFSLVIPGIYLGETPIFYYNHYDIISRYDKIVRKY